MTETSDSTLSNEQQDTAKLLDRVLGRAVTDRYVDLCRIASGAFELRVSRPVAAHTMRELESMLRSALKVPMDVDAAGENSIDPVWFSRAKTALEQIGFEHAAVDKAVNALKPQVKHANAIRQIAARLGLASDGDIAKAWLDLTDTFGKAHERSYHRSLTVDDDFRETFQRPFEMVIRAVALALQRRYSSLMQRVEEIAAMPDKGHAIALFEGEIPGALPLQWHFFERLQDADWLPHLVRRNLLGPPFPAFAGDNGGLLREWPAGSYLQRMAESSDPDTRRLVASAVRNIAPSQHPDVRRRGMEIITALPTEEAATLADVAAGWLDLEDTFMSLSAAEKLVKKLALDGQGIAALTVATRLLQVFSIEGNVTSLYAQHMYEYSLPQLAPILTNACGIGALELLAALLHKTIVVDQEGRQDPAFDRTEYDQGPLADDTSGAHSIYDALKCEVRRSAAVLIDADATEMPAIIDVFAKSTPKLFRRFELAVLSRKPSAMPARATALLLDSELVEARWCTHEYAELAVAWFPSMSPQEQQALLDLVDALPGRYVDGWRQLFEQREGRPPGPEDERVFSALIVRDALWYWRAVLPHDRRSDLDAVVTELGDPEAWKHRHWAGEEKSPLTGPDLATRPAAEIAAFLRTWRSGEEPRRQTVSALGMELRNAAARHPSKYAQAAAEFADVPAVYVHRLLEGLGDAVRNDGNFPWAPVLMLLAETFLRWRQHVDPASVAEGNDPSWQWACAAGAELLRAGLRRGAAGIPHERKAAVQGLILALARCAPRNPELDDFEERFDRDPYLASASTLRGAAVELCVLYLFWLSKEEGAALVAIPHAALDMTPEIRAVLDAELADRTSSGRVPRAVFGCYLRWVFYFGKPWLVASMGSIFPQFDEQLRRAAWLGHLIHSEGPLGEMLPFLEADYARAIDRLDREQNDRVEHGEKNLANHLLILYLHRHLELQPDGGLVERFLHKASPRLRQHVMWWLGLNLKQPPDRFPETLRARALAYWDCRLAAGEAAHDRSGFQEELGSIGQWCDNHQLDPDWLFDQLLRMLKSGFAPSPAYGVVEWLAKISVSRADRAVELLEALVTKPNGDHPYIGEDHSIRTVLAAGHERGTPATVERVKEVVSYLASVGQTGFLDLAR